MAFSPFRSSRALHSWFAFRDPALLFARATLDQDNLALTGWTWRGRYQRQIPFDRILHADARGDDELILWLFDGETLRLRMKHARAWKDHLDTQMEASQNSVPSTASPRKP